MKRKYYLRGLGLGILITALVFIVAGPSELSEEEIIKRAEELGYVKSEENVTPSIDIKNLLESDSSENNTVNTPVPQPTKAPAATHTPVPTEEPTPTMTETPTPVPTNTPVPTQAPTPEPTATPVPTKEPEASVVTATIVVERGNTATVVCDKIEAAGILKEGKALRDYLMEHNLTDYINVGSYTLSSEMSLKEIAEILTGR